MEKTFKHDFGDVTIKLQNGVFNFFIHGACFYDIDQLDWPRMKSHMMDKNWFSQEMSDFITSNIPVC